VGAVQDFQALIHWCGHDLDRTKAVQRALKVLRVPKGWQTATAHAKTAVAEDNHPRMFTNGAGLALLFRCRQGKVDLSTVLGNHDMLCCSCVHPRGWAPGKLCFFFASRLIIVVHAEIDPSHGRFCARTSHTAAVSLARVQSFSYFAQACLKDPRGYAIIL
jgi:hypothetical protein